MSQDPTTTIEPTATSNNTSAQAGLYCPFCGYDMRSRFDDACPECGESVDEAAMKRAQVPWANRREIGRVRAVWRTFWRVSFRTRLFARAVAQPVDLEEALRFRRLVVVLLWLTLSLTAWLMGFGPGLIDFLADANIIHDVYWFDLGPGWKLLVALIPAAMLGVWLYACTGVHTYFFHPRGQPVERQNRAVALSYYACAPLLLVLLGIVFLAAGLILQDVSDQHRGVDLLETASTMIALVGGGLITFSLLAFWSTTSHLAIHAAGRGLGGRLAVMSLQPAAWLLLTVLIGGLLPVGLGYGYLLATSF